MMTDKTSAPRWSSVEDYLSAQDPVKAKTLRSIIALILKQFPELAAKVSWNVPTIHRDGKYVVGLAAYKNHLTFAPWSAHILLDFSKRLEKYVLFKNCFQIPVDWQIDRALVTDLVRARLAELDVDAQEENDMMVQKNEESPAALIDARIDELGGWRGEALAHVRALIKQADPHVVEEWKWGVPVWSHDGLICTGEAYKAAVKLTFAKGASLADPKQLFNSSLDGNVRRAIDIREGDVINATAFKALIREAVKHNQSPGSAPKKKRS